MCVGKCGIEVPAVAVDAFAHGALKGRVRPVADAGLDIGRDIGAVDRAERRFDWTATGVEYPVDRGVTGRAVAKRRQLPATFDGGCRKYGRLRPGDRCDRAPGQDSGGDTDAAGDKCGGGGEDAASRVEGI